MKSRCNKRWKNLKMHFHDMIIKNSSSSGVVYILIGSTSQQIITQSLDGVRRPLDFPQDRVLGLRYGGGGGRESGGERGKWKEGRKWKF